jgi:hypothetical protein
MGFVSVEGNRMADIEQVYREVCQLSSYERMILLSKMIAEVSGIIANAEGVDFYQIKGVGREIWKDTDAQEYVNSERSSWE